MQSLKPLIPHISLTVLSFVLLSACGQGFDTQQSTAIHEFRPPLHSSHPRGNNTVILNSPDQQPQSLRIEASRKPIDSLRQAPAASSSQLQSSLDIQGVRLRLKEDNPQLLELRIKLALNDKTPHQNSTSIEGEFYYFEFSARITQTGHPLDTLSKDGSLRIFIRCPGINCSEARIELTHISSGESANIGFRRSIEYFANHSQVPKDFAALSASQRILLEQAIEYNFPIERHIARVGQRILQTLVVNRPPIDSDEGSDETDNLEETQSLELDSVEILTPLTGPPQSTAESTPDASSSSPSTNVSPQPPLMPAKPERPVESALEPPPPIEAAPLPPLMPAKPERPVESSAPDAPSSPPSTSESPRPENAIPLPNSSQTTGQPGSSQTADLVLIPNPWEAFNIQIPNFTISHPIRDPVNINVHFAITPAQNQQPLEPAHRLVAFAQAIIDQRVPIHLHACNYYIRTAMTLAGYTEGYSYLANDFHLLFQTPGQGLDEWEEREFNLVDLPRLREMFNHLPAGYGVVVQIVRPTPRRGHLGIVAKNENGTLWFYDSSLRIDDENPGRPPSARILRDQHLNSNNPTAFRVFSFPRLIRDGTVRI